MTSRKDQSAPPADAAPDEIASDAAEGMLGPNPFIGLRGRDMLASARDIAGLGRYALATMCIGGGQGIATIWERT